MYQSVIIDKKVDKVFGRRQEFPINKPKREVGEGRLPTALSKISGTSDSIVKNLRYE